MRFQCSLLALAFCGSLALAAAGDDLVMPNMYMPPENIPPGSVQNPDGSITFPPDTVIFADSRTGEAFPFIPEGPDELQALRQVMKDDDAINERLKEKGIDPNEFFTKAYDPGRSTALSRAAVQQRLIDDGIADEGMFARSQTLNQMMALNAIRRRLNSTDDEWAIIQPKMVKVVAALSDAGQLSKADRRLATSFLMPTPSPALTRAFYRLQDLLQDQQVAPSKIAVYLADYRRLRDQAQTTYQAASEDLRGVLTLRQEAVLVDLGILD